MLGLWWGGRVGFGCGGRRLGLPGVTSEQASPRMVRIDKLLESQGYSTATVAMCLATGGVADMPAIKARLHELFGPQRVHVSERTASLISEGRRGLLMTMQGFTWQKTWNWSWHATHTCRCYELA
jgi:hypothetical protein